MKMRGLPFDAGEREVAEWMEEAGKPMKINIEMDRLVKLFKR